MSAPGLSHPPLNCARQEGKKTSLPRIVSYRAHRLARTPRRTFTGTLAELPYFSSAMEVWRGLRDLGRVFEDGGLGPNRTAAGKRLLATATTLSKDISNSWTRSVQAAGCPPYVAGAAMNRSIELNNCTRVEGLVKQYHEVGGPGLPPTRPAKSFSRVSEPWRAFAEMFHSGWLSDNDTAAVYRYQQNHDSLMRLGVGGGVNLENAMFGHTAYGAAYGLVAASMSEEFILFLYAQSHHAATAGTWTFWEKVLIDRSKGMCCFAAPAQLTVPSALRWALVFEDEARGLVAMARTLPRRWLSGPNASLSVQRAPVSRRLLQGGSVGFVLQRSGSAHHIVASVNASGPAGEALSTLSLRLRLPLSWGPIKTVTSGSGDDWTGNVVDGDVLLLCADGKLPKAAALSHIDIAYGNTMPNSTPPAIYLPKLITSNMVLQAERPSLFGWASGPCPPAAASKRLLEPRVFGVLTHGCHTPPVQAECATRHV